jgi:hypothetical protein
LSEAGAASPFTGERAPASPRADLVTAAVLFALGVAIVHQAFAMPRFVEQSGTGLTAPGIVPGFYGVMIARCRCCWALRAIRRGGWAVQRDGAAGAGEGRRLLLAAALGVLYAGVLVGRMPVLDGVGRSSSSPSPPPSNGTRALSAACAAWSRPR